MHRKVHLDFCQQSINVTKTSDNAMGSSGLTSNILFNDFLFPVLPLELSCNLSHLPNVHAISGSDQLLFPVSNEKNSRMK